jgi:hypothetical protein
METFKETSQEYDATQWREWLTYELDMPLASTELMDKIAEAVSGEELEKAYEKLAEGQRRAVVRGIRSEPRPGLKISAMIDCAREKGVITADEARQLEYRIASRV